jgi:prepilin peptidase CpaA
LLISAAIYDVKSFRIPNFVCIAIAALFPLFVILAPHKILWEQNLFICAVVLVAGILLFAKKYTGAGDIKLIAAISLWAGTDMIGPFLLVTAFTGGLLSLSLAGLAYLRKRETGSEISIAKTPIPYGVAIAIGGLCVILMLSSSLFVTVAQPPSVAQDIGSNN